MAIAKNGINGSFRGKVGSVIGYELGGQNVMRSVGRRTKPFTERELLNQQKMKVVSGFLGPIISIVKFGFQRETPASGRVGAFQLAQSYVRKNAVDLDGEGKPFVNPAKVLFSKGELDRPANCTMKCEDSVLTIRWDYFNRGADDRLMVLLYRPGRVFFVDFRDVGAKRQEREDVWKLGPLDPKYGPVHVYAAFRDTIQDVVSDSVYCGTIDPGAPSAPDIGHTRLRKESVRPTPQSGQLGLAFPDL
jgi:hypothetical protein